jgi:isovaleryl-CoA dehydrogenase
MQLLKKAIEFFNSVLLFQMIQAKMADMYTILNASRSYTYNVARCLERGQIMPNVSVCW